ncbi:MAG: proteasome ATPase, partial [Acidimicrobiia bacterium]|nr:proteasome ATPase [Acidimicrobiia bacterium]
PDDVAARSIFRNYLTTGLPIHPDEVAKHGTVEAAIEAMIDATASFMYRTEDETRFLEVTYQNGDKEILYFKDFSSGAMIENIVRRAKKLAIKRFLADGVKGICLPDLLESVTQEYKEHEDLPNTTNPDDWAKISGKKGERIVYVRTLVGPAGEKHGGRAIEQVATGQYL